MLMTKTKERITTECKQSYRDEPGEANVWKFQKGAIAMNKIIVLCTFLTVILFSSIATNATGINVNVNDERVVFEGQQPVNIDGRTLVPIRGVFEVLGFEVGWNPQLRQATLARPGAIVVLTIDSASFTVNGVTHMLDVPAQVIADRTMIPIRAVLESVGYEMDWNGLLIQWKFFQRRFR